MTIIEKLSDRGGFIFDAVYLVLTNKGTMKPVKLQWELFQLGVFIKLPLLKQAISVMIEKGQLSPPKPEPELTQVLKEKAKIITDVFSKEEKQA